MVQIEVTVPMEQVSLHPSTNTGSISCKTECVTSKSDQLQSIIPRPEVVPAKAIETGIILSIVEIKKMTRVFLKKVPDQKENTILLDKGAVEILGKF